MFFPIAIGCVVVAGCAALAGLEAPNFDTQGDASSEGGPVISDGGTNDATSGSFCSDSAVLCDDFDRSPPLARWDNGRDPMSGGVREISDAQAVSNPFSFFSHVQGTVAGKQSSGEIWKAFPVAPKRIHARFELYVCPSLGNISTTGYISFFDVGLRKQNGAIYYFGLQANKDGFAALYGDGPAYRLEPHEQFVTGQWVHVDVVTDLSPTPPVTIEIRVGNAALSLNDIATAPPDGVGSAEVVLGAFAEDGTPPCDFYFDNFALEATF